MRFLRTLAGVSAIVASAATAGAQQVVLNFDDLSSCSNTPLSSYAGWIALSNGASCQHQAWSYWGASSAPNYVFGNYSLGWTFNSPVTFDGVYASGFGTWNMILKSGGQNVFQKQFSMYGSTYLITSGFGGMIDQVILTQAYGATGIGIDNIEFTPPPPPPPPIVVQGCTTNCGVPGDVTPEPTTLLLMASGLSGLGVAFRRRRRAPLEHDA